MFSKFKKRRTKGALRVLLIVMCVVFIWRGFWGIADTIFEIILKDYSAWGYVIALLFGLFVLYFDDFKLDELKQGHSSK